MKRFLEALYQEAKTRPQRIVFPDGDEKRVQEAARSLEEQKLVLPILLKGDLRQDARFEDFAATYAKLREEPIEKAREEVSKPHTFGTLMVLKGEVDGMVGGPAATSKERILPALRLLKPEDPEKRVSGFFFMVLPGNVDPDAANGGILMFSDCAVNIDPNAKELCQIALESAKTARDFGLFPKVALLSFSTKGSAEHPQLEKIRKAVDELHELDPNLLVDGEMQVDAALMDAVAKIKAPASPVAGQANVLIFPDLNSGNIAYKLVERLAGATAIGPLLQGLQKPVNEVSRGASVQDIIHVAVLTAVQSIKSRPA